MKQEGLISSYTTAQFKPQKDRCNESKVANVLNRQSQNQPYRNVVVSDLTYVRVGNHWNYMTEISVYYWASIITRRLNAGGVKVLTPPIPVKRTPILSRMPF